MKFLLAISSVLTDKIDYIIGFLAIFFMSQTAAFITVGTLVFLDLFTGLWNAKKNNIKITSDRLKNTATKFVMYNVLIITCMITEYYAVHQIPFIKVGLGIIATVEALSIFENIENILNIKIVSRFKEVFSRRNPINVIEDEEKEQDPEKKDKEPPFRPDKLN